MDGIKGRVAGVGALLSTLMIGAFVLASGAGATTDPVDDAFADLTTKSNHYGALLVALIAGVVVLLFGIAWIRKGRSAH
jgi:uncharacterized membrane protein HdeD (DUF308 family)